MRKYFKYVRAVVIVIVFIVFNFLLVNNLSVPKAAEEKMMPKIVLISHVYSNPYWQYVKMGAEKAAKERKAIVDFEGPDNASADEGIKYINMAYAAKVGGVIAYVQDEEKYKPVIGKLFNAGIPLVTVDSDAENSKRLAYVGTDNINAGKIAAKEMIKQVGNSGDVGIIMGGRNVKNQIERVKGFTDYINANSKLVISNIESSDSYLLEAELGAKKILMSNSNIKAIFCASALDGQGVAKAVTNLGFTGRVKIVSFDDLPETLDYIKNGIINATIVQQPYMMGYNAVNIIMDNIEGKDVKGIFLTDVLVVSKDNLDDYKKKQGEKSIEHK